MNLSSALKTEFWTNHKIGNTYSIKNRNGSIEYCKLVYYPLDNYDDFSALIEIDKGTYIDFREVPIRFLINIPKTGNIIPEK